MKAKNKIGALVVLGGIALLGLYWFKKNKPTIASSQLKSLEALSNSYKLGTSGESIIKGYKPPTSEQSSGNIGNFMSSQQTKAINESVNLAVSCSNPFIAQRDGVDCTEYCRLNPKNCPDYKDPISQNLQGVNWSDLSNLGLAGLTFDNIIKK